MHIGFIRTIKIDTKNVFVRILFQSDYYRANEKVNQIH